MGKNTIPTAPSQNSSLGSGGSTPGGGGGGGGGGTAPSSSSSSSGGGGDPYAYAKRAEAKADREASEKWLAQARTIQQQIDALRMALGPKGFKRRLDQQLKNVRTDQRDTRDLLMEGYHDRIRSLRDTVADNEKAAAGQSALNQTNRVRERANATAEATSMGAGESDLLRAQQASLNNWQSNQSEIARSYFDSLTSANASRVDMTVDTRTGLVNNAIQANQDREQYWTNYYDRRSETLTALGNALGQQAEYYGLADEAIDSNKVEKKQKRAAHLSGNAFDQASHAAGNAWDDPGVPKKLKRWDGAKEFESASNDSKFSGAATELAVARPERATLRSW